MYIEVELAEPYKNHTNKHSLYRGGYIAEPKINGMRGELTAFGSFSRYANKFGFDPKIIEALNSLIVKLGFNIDGEFEYKEYDKAGKPLPHYERWKKLSSIIKQKRIPTANLTSIVFNAFDIIPINGNYKLRDRKTILSKVIPVLNKVSPFKIVECPFVVIKSEKDFNYWFDIFLKKGYEGLVLKNFDSVYKNKRTFDWLKHKGKWTSDLPILRIEAGTKGKKNENRAGVVVVKTPMGETKLGTGFSEKGKESRQYFWDNKDNIKGVVVEVEHEGYANSEGKLVNAAFKCIRFDKPRWDMSF